MSSNVPIGSGNRQAGAPTPVNTPLNTSVLGGGNAPPTLSRPTVPDVEEDEEGGDEGALRRELLGALVQDRIQGLIGRSSGYIEGLSDDVKKTIEGLKGVDAEYLAIFKQFKKESLELEAKYATKYAPVFTRRAAIIAGQQKPTDADITKGVEVSKEDDEEYTPIAASVAPAAEGIKDFWLTALRNHVGISELVTERDEKALSALKDVRVTLLPVDTPGYKLEFEFAENEFFSNTILTKVYYYEDELDYQGDYVYKKAEGCEISWKDDEKNLTKSFEIKKQRNKNTNRTRLVRKAHPAESFFNFFTPPTPPNDDEDEDEDEDQLEELEQRLELDYQIGEDLKERVIPRAIDFFTGKALEYEDFEDEDDDYEGLDEDDEDDDEEDSDDDDSPQLRRRAPAAGSNAPNAEECKQQ